MKEITKATGSTGKTETQCGKSKTELRERKIFVFSPSLQWLVPPEQRSYNEKGTYPYTPEHKDTGQD